MYDNPDVLIHVGEGDNAKDFYAHKNILTKRSLYFNAALSNTWARVEGDKMVLRKPNVSPRVFEMLLRSVEWAMKRSLITRFNTRLFDPLLIAHS